jgi:putative transposon-encoded protein
LAGKEIAGLCVHDVPDPLVILLLALFLDEHGCLITVKITAYQIVEKTVKQSGNSGRVYVPVEWIGKKVKVALLEPIEE